MQTMNVYIWEEVDDLTDNYHSGGGTVVIANSLEEARKQLPENCSAQTDHPIFEAELNAITPRVFVFPNAGCC